MADLDDETARWVADRFALGRVRSARRVARGAVGEVHRVDTDTGAYAVKRAFWSEDPDAVVESRAQREAELVERCRSVGVRAPRTVPARDGAPLVRDAAGTAWRVHEFVVGTVPEASDLAAEQWVLAQGAVVHALALPAAPGESVDGWYTTVGSDWAELVGRAEAAGADWAPRLRGLAPDLDRLGDWASDVPLGDVVRCHRDLKADNTLVCPDGARWLLDWEESGPHDPAREVGSALLRHLDEPAVVAALAEAYGAAGGVVLPADASLFASGVAVRLNFLSVQAEALLAPDTPAEHRDFALACVRGLLAGMPTAADLDDGARVAAAAAAAAARGRRRAPRTMGS